jgi:hypothetical protein
MFGNGGSGNRVSIATIGGKHGARRAAFDRL